MAKYYDVGVSDMTFLADADLTSKQYFFVCAASVAGYVKLATGASDPGPLGALQNSPSLGQEARVRIFGPTKLVAKTPSGCGLAFGRFITASTGGQATPQDGETSCALLGRWLDTTLAVSSSVIGQAFINCAGFAACAMSAS